MEKTPQNNFSHQNFSVANNYFNPRLKPKKQSVKETFETCYIIKYFCVQITMYILSSKYIHTPLSFFTGCETMSRISCCMFTMENIDPTKCI